MLTKDAAIEMLRTELLQHQMGKRPDDVRAVLEATQPHNVIKGPTVLTDEIVDAPRGILRLAYTGSLTYAQIKEYLELRGDELSWWPEFADKYDGKSYVTKSGLAILIYNCMTAVGNPNFIPSDES